MSAFLTKPTMGKNYINEIRSVAQKHRALIDEDTMEDLKEAFSLFDVNHNGKIELRELKAAMRALGHVNIRKQQCIEMFRELDKDPASSLNFDEFCKVMRSRMPKKDPYEEAKKIFEFFD